MSYRTVHTLAPSSAVGAANASQSTLPSSRPGTPPRDAGTPATSTPNGSSVNKDGTVLLDCVGCGRAVCAKQPFPPPPAGVDVYDVFFFWA